MKLHVVLQAPEAAISTKQGAFLLSYDQLLPRRTGQAPATAQTSLVSAQGWRGWAHHCLPLPNNF